MDQNVVFIGVQIPDELQRRKDGELIPFPVFVEHAQVVQPDVRADAYDIDCLVRGNCFRIVALVAPFAPVLG